MNAGVITYVTIVQFHVHSRNCSALLKIQPVLGFDQPLTQYTKQDIISGMELPDCEAIHSSYSSKVKNKWSYTYTTTQHITARCLIKHFFHTIPVTLNVFSVLIICIHKRCQYWNVYSLFIICIHTDVTTEMCIPCLLSVFTIDVTTDMHIPCFRFANQNFNTRITLMLTNFFVQLVEYLCFLSISDSCFYLHILLMYC